MIESGVLLQGEVSKLTERLRDAEEQVLSLTLTFVTCLECDTMETFIAIMCNDDRC